MRGIFPGVVEIQASMLSEVFFPFLEVKVNVMW